MIMIVMGLVLFLPAVSLRFWQAWILWAIFSLLTLMITAYFLKKDPGLLSRRMKVKEEEPQPAIFRVLSLLSMLAYVVPGLDYRFHWSAMPVWLVITADVMVLLGYVLIFIVFRENSEAMLVKDLPGYTDYLNKTRYRLIPFIW